MSLFEKALGLSDATCGVRGFLVMHSTTRGPATGGIRLYPYASDEDALADGVRLARAMTFKAAAADLPVGGGKIVLMTPPESKRKDALRFIGRTIESLKGGFLAGRDVGVPVEDGAVVREQTSYMVDESDEGVGDLNRATALGVVAGIKAAVAFELGRTSLDGARIAVQGAGGVGAWLAKELASEGAELSIADTSPDALAALSDSVSFEAVGADAIYAVECDVFAPCAIGGVLDERTSMSLNAKIVAGSANNVLTSRSAGAILQDRSILFVPDFLINAGALIQGTRFLLHGERGSPAAIAAIGERTTRLLERAKSAAISPIELLDNELGDLSAQFDLHDGFNL